MYFKPILIIHKIKKTLLLCITVFLMVFPTAIFAYGGGGGNYTYDPPIVSSKSLIINNGDKNTTSTLVELTISAENTYQMAISNNFDFKNSVWEKYTTQKQWILLPENGEKKVYIKFKSSSGDISNIISASIILNYQATPNGADFNSDSHVDDYDLSFLLSNWGTPIEKSADINTDGRADDLDYSILLSQWTG